MLKCVRIVGSSRNLCQVNKHFWHAEMRLASEDLIVTPYGGGWVSWRIGDSEPSDYVWVRDVSSKHQIRGRKGWWDTGMGRKSRNYDRGDFFWSEVELCKLAGRIPAHDYCFVNDSYWKSRFRCEGVWYHRHPYGGGWVAGNATVDKTAFVGIGAMVYPGSAVKDMAWICEGATIDGGIVMGESVIFGTAYIKEGAIVKDRAVVGDCSWVGGGAIISGKAHVLGKSYVSDEAEVRDRAYCCDVNLYGGTVLSGNARVYADAC